MHVQDIVCISKSLITEYYLNHLIILWSYSIFFNFVILSIILCFPKILNKYTTISKEN